MQHTASPIVLIYWLKGTIQEAEVIECLKLLREHENILDGA